MIERGEAAAAAPSAAALSVTAAAAAAAVAVASDSDSGGGLHTRTAMHSQLTASEEMGMGVGVGVSERDCESSKRVRGNVECSTNRLTTASDVQPSPIPLATHLFSVVDLCSLLRFPDAVDARRPSSKDRIPTLQFDDTAEVRLTDLPYELCQTH